MGVAIPFAGQLVSMELPEGLSAEELIVAIPFAGQLVSICLLCNFSRQATC